MSAHNRLKASLQGCIKTDSMRPAAEDKMERLMLIAHNGTDWPYRLIQNRKCKALLWDLEGLTDFIVRMVNLNLICYRLKPTQKAIFLSLFSRKWDDDVSSIKSEGSNDSSFRTRQWSKQVNNKRQVTGKEMELEPAFCTFVTYGFLVSAPRPSPWHP